MKLVGHVVSHTHWDRAWYQPFEVYRLRLVRLMRKLLDILESDRDYRFMFDGQTVPFEDYLEVFPSDRRRIERLVKAGRLVVGPFYVLPDQFLVTGESLIRNLQIGIEQARALGGTQREGALSDLFGHPGQVPQILNGFGIRSAFVARGLTRKQLARGWVQRWRAPDGHSEVTLCAPPGGYANLYYWGFDAFNDYPTPPTDADGWSVEQARRQLDRLLDEYLAGGMTSRHLFLGNGVDHQEAQPHAGELIRRLNRMQKRVHLVHSTLAGLFAAVRREGRKLPVIEGPLDNCDMTGCMTSRIHLKQAYAEIAGRIEMLTEPLCACVELFGRGWRAWREPHHHAFTLNAGPNWAAFPEHPSRELEYLWKLLLRNAPHDDICGCSVDATHRDMENRFKRAGEINEHLLNDALLVMASRLAETCDESDVPVLVVFNPHPFECADVLRTEVFLKNVSSVRSLRLLDVAGLPVDFAVESSNPVERAEWDGNDWRKEPARGLAVRLALRHRLPPYSFVLLKLFLDGPPLADAPKHETAWTRMLGGSAVVDDPFRRIVIRPDGTFDVFDKRLKRQFRGLGVLEDVEDVGCGYYTKRFAKPAPPVTSPGAGGKLRIVSHHELSTTVETALTLRLPVRATDDYTRRDERTVGVPVLIRFDIPHDGGAVRQTVRVENRARDHHLFLRFPTGLAAETFAGDAKFDWRSYPVGHEQARVDSSVVVAAGRAAFALASDCPTVIDSRRDRRGVDIGLTLFRSVDQVSRAVKRDVWVGEESECLMPVTRRLAWTTGGEAKVTRECRRVRRTLIAPPALIAVTPRGKHRYRGRKFTTLGVPDGPLVEITGGDVELSCWKKADDGDGWIIRVYSLDRRPRKYFVRANVPVRWLWLCQLDESRVRRLRRDRGGWWEYQSRPRQIVTLRIVLKHR